MAKTQEGDIEVPSNDELFGGSAPAFAGENPTRQGAEQIFDLLGGSDEERDVGEARTAGESGENDPAPGPEETTEADEPVEAEGREEAPVETEEAEEVEGVEPGEHDDEVESEEPSEETSDPDDLKQTYTVKVDGEEQEVTLEEALQGYMRTSAFTRKTQELAEERRSMRQEAAQLRGERQQYVEGLDKIETVLEALQPQKPDPELANTRPQEYARRQREYERRQEQLESIREEKSAAQEQNQADTQEAYREYLEHQREMLVAEIPELTDPDQRQEIEQSMMETAQLVYGFEPHELQNVHDWRALKMLYDASQYRELQNQAEEVTSPSKKQKKESSKTLKPGSSSGGGSKSKSGGRGDAEARKRLQKSGRVEDAAAVIESLIPEE